MNSSARSKIGISMDNTYSTKVQNVAGFLAALIYYIITLLNYL